MTVKGNGLAISLSLILATSATVFGATPKQANPTDYYPGKTWEKAEPSRVGMDPARLGKLNAYIGQEFPKFRSLLIIHKGKMVVEDYFHGASPGQRQNVKSVTKSVISSLVGMALADGSLDSVEKPLTGIFPSEVSGLDDSTAKGKISLKDLLTMRSGLDIDENSPEMMDIFSGYGDWLTAILKRPMARDTGGEFHYSTCDTHLLSCAFTRITGHTLLDYAVGKLFKPLGITSCTWSADPMGNSFGGSELYITPEGMARFGYLYLRKGKWNGRQLVPDKWITESTTDPFMKKGESSGEGKFGQYGYLWWIRSSGGYRTFYAAGYGGQYIFIIPELDLVTVVTQTITYDNDSTVYSTPFNLLDYFIIPSIRK